MVVFLVRNEFFLHQLIELFRKDQLSPGIVFGKPSVQSAFKQNCL